MAMAAGISAIGGAISGGLGFLGSKAAAKAQTDASKQAQETTMRMFQQAQAQVAPYAQAGQSVLPTLQKLLTPGPGQTETLSQMPGFQFAQDWGQRAIMNQAARLGYGGNVLAEGAKFSTGLAQQGFGQLAGLLQNFANMGSSAAGTLGGQATTAGTNLANLQVGAGQAQAAGTMGGMNALAGGIQPLMNMGQLFAMKNMFGGQQQSPLSASMSESAQAARGTAIG